MLSGMKELTPGGYSYPERMSDKLLCLNDCWIGCVRARGLCAGPMGWCWFYMVSMPSSSGEFQQRKGYGGRSVCTVIDEVSDETR